MIFIVFRTVIIYIVVTLAIRLMGKRQIGDMQPNELVITLLISEIAAIPLQDINQPVLLGIVAIFVLVFLEIIISILTMKIFKFRQLMSGKSAVIIKNGVIDQQTMRDVRMTVLDLIELLREKDVFDIKDVAFAVLEVNGSLSILKNSDAQTVTRKDMKISGKEEALQLPVITDGKVIKESLKNLSMNYDKIISILKSKNKSPENVFLMTVNRNGDYTIIDKESRI
ncbi:MAG: DUF421 domain-containing protein [Clostridia bacterium]|nr:DUF421 domain-containing protein [Clostridia bacterium]